MEPKMMVRFWVDGGAIDENKPGFLSFNKVTELMRNSISMSV